MTIGQYLQISSNEQRFHSKISRFSYLFGKLHYPVTFTTATYGMTDKDDIETQGIPWKGPFRDIRT